MTTRRRHPETAVKGPTPAGVYQVVMVRMGSDSRPRWGVRRPEGDLVTAGGRIQECVRRQDAERVADQRNQARGLG